MDNALVTWASGQEFCNSEGFSVFLKSIALVDADVYVLTHDMPETIREHLAELSINVVDVPTKNVHFLLRDRHYHFWQFINNDRCLHHFYGFVDCKDVIFQSDPFIFFKQRGYCADDDFRAVFLTCEGMEHKDSAWNLNDQFQAQIDVREFKFSCEANPVINGGVVFGKGACLMNHFFLLWATTLKSSGNCTDQGVLNYLYHFLQRQTTDQYIVCDPRRDTFCLTGEAIKHNMFEVKFEDNLYKNLAGDPYVMVHQWDRLAQKQVIIEKWLGGNHES